MNRKAKPSKASEDDEFGVDNTFYVSCIETEEGPKIFNVFIYRGIESPEQFIPAIEALQVANEDDLVMVHLSTPGGDIDATDTFLHACEMCRGRIVFNASGGVHSAGTLILMNADEVIFSEGFNALVHNGMVGHGGKFSEWVAASDYARKHMESLFWKTYKGFMTDEEIQLMLEGKDFWFDAEEFKERHAKRATLNAK